MYAIPLNRLELQIVFIAIYSNSSNNVRKQLLEKEIERRQSRISDIRMRYLK